MQTGAATVVVATTTGAGSVQSSQPPGLTASTPVSKFIRLITQLKHFSVFSPAILMTALHLYCIISVFIKAQFDAVGITCHLSSI